jgi:hypothetical protein
LKLESLKRLQNDGIKRLILRVLRKMESGSCRQSSLVKHICSLTDVTTLRGKPRQDFETKVNHAVGALLREKPPKFERPNKSSDLVRLTKRRKRRASPPKVATQSKNNIVSMDAGRDRALPRLEVYLVCAECGTRTLANLDAVDLVCRKCHTALKAS